MPYYEIIHTTALSSEQKQSIASSLTTLHTSSFATPSLFVHISFSQPPSTTTNTSSSPCPDYFIAGKPRPFSNRILVHVRSGSRRGTHAFQDLAEGIEKIWCDTVRHEAAQDKLVAVFIVPGLVAREAGLAIPEAGTEREWFEGIKGMVEERGKRGDEEMRDLVEEFGTRDDLRSS